MLGDQGTGPLTGNVSGTSVTIMWTHPDTSVNLTATVSGNRMSGSVSSSKFQGTWAVVKQ